MENKSTLDIRPLFSELEDEEIASMLKQTVFGEDKNPIYDSFNPMQDLNDCYLVENFIEREGLQNAYEMCMLQMVAIGQDGRGNAITEPFGLIHAKARVRTHACMIILGLVQFVGFTVPVVVKAEKA